MLEKERGIKLPLLGEAGYCCSSQLPAIFLILFDIKVNQTSGWDNIFKSNLTKNKILAHLLYESEFLISPNIKI